MEHIVNIVHPVPIPNFWVNPGRGHGKCQLHQLYLGGSSADDLRNRTDRAPTNRTYDSLLQVRAVDLNRPTPKGPNPVAAVAVIARRVVSARRAAQDGVVSPVKRPDDVRCSPPGDPRRGRAPFGALQRRSSVTMNPHRSLHRSLPCTKMRSVPAIAEAGFEPYHPAARKTPEKI